MSGRSRDGDPLAVLPAELRAVAAAGLMHLGADAPRVLERVAGGAASVCAARRVLELERRSRAALLARAVVELRAPVPAGLEAVHPDWTSDAAREGLADSTDVDSRVRTWLQRRAYGELVSMPTAAAEGAAALVHLEPARLVRALTAWGRRTLAVASLSAPRRQIAELAARLGDRHGPAFIADVAAAVAGHAGPDRRARIVQRALAGRAVSSRSLVSIGLDRLSSLLIAEGGDLVRQVAQRLPRELGTELLAGAREPSSAAGEPAHVDTPDPARASDPDVGAELAELLACFDE